MDNDHQEKTVGERRDAEPETAKEDERVVDLHTTDLELSTLGPCAEVESIDVKSPSSVPAAANDRTIVDEVDAASCNSRVGQRLWRRLLTPPTASYNPDTFKFTLPINVFFAVACMILISQPFWCQPLLVILSQDLRVSYSDISKVPTLALAGSALGLVVVTPAGDFANRRYLTLAFMALCLPIQIGIATSRTYTSFLALHFLLGLCSSSAGLLTPLAFGLAKPEQRAHAMGIILAGLTLGGILARALSGVVAHAAGWPDVYWLMTGLSSSLLVLSYFCLPDVPVKQGDISIWRIYYDMVMAPYRFPMLSTSLLLNFLLSMSFGSFWTTLTYLLHDHFDFNPSKIGLFSLIGIVGCALAPFTGRLVDQLDSWVALCLGLGVGLITWAIEVAVAGMSIGGPIQAIIVRAENPKASAADDEHVAQLVDLTQQLVSIPNRVRVLALSDIYRARLNSLLSIAGFTGQVAGTAVGSAVYAKYGWRACQGLSLGLVGACLLVHLSRGPNSTRVIGWDGGSEIWGEDRSRGINKK